MTRKSRSLQLSPLLFLLLASLSLSAWAQGTAKRAAEEKTQDTLSVHIVKEGETLQSITEHYLGSPHLWPENAKLNPEVRDPHRIYPGQKLQIIVKREIPAQQVEIRKVARSVHKNLQFSGWKNATAGDLLKPRDGVRTQHRSSTELGFDDGTSLTLGEYSTVFVKDVSTTLRGVRRGTIEIEKGQAELVFEAQRPDTTKIEVITGSAITRPQVGPTGTSRTRARASEDGGSRVMVYGGQAEVESGGVRVAVDRGMGTAVPEGSAPKPPEKLLPRPKTISPAKNSEWAYANPPIQWRPVPGAVSYTVEICSDTTCGSLVTRADLKDTNWTPDALPGGDLFWRVTATAASGLDGYPSRAVPFRVLGDRPDLEPPVVVARLRGAGYVEEDGGFVLGYGGGLELIAHDDVAGVTEIRYRWDEGAWAPYQGKVLSPPSDSGHRLEWRAIDRLGRESQAWTLQVSVDDAPPPTPTVEIP